ncbi:E3 ubiquitin-ligase COP1-like isoform X3 [Micractinium conductrix]|uniref:E3 ubiquitin-ligase COP1-like isoform X3 n=1 Tax=Micractinium conductrix TaxID=554055 RepID=A0A2P6VBQ8_9CHLO|nr:E3 ubiquitin-ligase COP1-like isoform X3 [Micractinium conductrix]|eukprot:PSC71525.1 E3 ubiquitin-ligase COP1-like isoform X3 [Micractinium conductrix]
MALPGSLTATAAVGSVMLAAPLPPSPAAAAAAPAAGEGTCETIRREDLACPVCLETLADPFVTACGHSFCYACIARHLEAAKNCPACAAYLSADLIYPNFLLSKIVKRARSRALDAAPPPLELLQQAISDHAAVLGEPELDVLLRQVWQLRQGLLDKQKEASMELLLHFLQSSRSDKVKRLEQLQKELQCLEGDIQRVEAAGVSAAGSHQARPTTPAARPSSAASDVKPASPPPPVPQHPESAEGFQQGLEEAAAVVAQRHGATAAAAADSAQAEQAAASAGQPAQQLEQQQAVAAAGGGAVAVEAARPSIQQHAQFFQQQQQQLAAFAAQQAAAAHAVQQQQLASFASGLAPQTAGPASAAFSGGAPGRGAAAAAAGGAAMAAQPAAAHATHPPYARFFGSLASPAATAATSSAGGGMSLSSGGRQRDVLSLLRSKKRRIASQFDDLQQCYLQLRAQQLHQEGSGGGGDGEGGAAPARAGPSSAVAAAAAGVAAAAAAGAGGGGEAAVGPLVDEGLQEFSRLLSVITRCNKLKLVAELPRVAPHRQGSSSIISSLEFDKEGSLFATAGVSKRISIYDFAGVAPQHSGAAAAGGGLPLGGSRGGAPVIELLSRSKLSCLSWNKYIQAQIASSDYEGVISVWDVSTGGLLHEYEAHSRRIWSVDFCAADPTLLASGSDDCAVKFWSTRSPGSVAQVETSANVCAVRWRPGSSHELAVGSADHCSYLYDLRNTSAPVRTFKGHRKAVSYVRFCSPTELVSASTDSTLRLWGADEAAAVPGGDASAASLGRALRVYEGHVNEKNFVGLAVDGDFLACGSETAQLFVYYKALSKPVAQQSFGAHDDGAEAQSDKGFISAVCWRPGAQTLLAANSQGAVKVYSLTGSSGSGGHA